MQKKELAEKIGISASMVSRLAKRGMPTDSLERALRWRKRHLEPGRVVGSKFDPAKGDQSKAEPIEQAAAMDPDLTPYLVESFTPRETGYDLCYLVKVAALLNQRLAAGQAELAAALLERLRAILRMTWHEDVPALPLRVWRALLLWALPLPVDTPGDEGRPLTPVELAAWHGGPYVSGPEVVAQSRDTFGYSIPGLHPEAEEDD